MMPLHPPFRHFRQDAPGNAVDHLPERSEIDPRYQWRVDDIFPGDDAWETALAEVENRLPEIAAMAGSLGASGEALLTGLQLSDAIEEVFSRLYIYAGLKNDQDSRVGTYQGYRDRATALMVRINQATAWMRPEILAIPPEELERYITETPGLATYRHQLEDLSRTREHVLDSEREQLLAMTGDIAQGPYQIFSMFNNADIRFPSIVDERGREVEVTKGRYGQLQESRDRRVRKDAYEAMYGRYGEWTNTLAATLSAAVKKDVFYARARRYPSALAAALDNDNIPTAVYDNVIGAVNANLAPLHGYMELRRRLLGLERLMPWDLNCPIVPDITYDIPFTDTRELLREGLRPLGEEYGAVLEKSFSEGWIDVYENKGKRSGAYSWATFGAHPYILLNYHGTLNDLFTTAHELGHALHSYYTHTTQPYHYSSYTIFVAEVASTLNEALLMDHLLKTTEDPLRRRFLLNEYIDKIRGTVYIQTLFAELEKELHDRVESGAPLTADALNTLTHDLYGRYFGPAFEVEERYRGNWCRIPHFYYNFYVYKYVTGFSAAIALSRRILDGDVTARDAYLRFLSRGNSDYSINLLRDAGVDMSRPDPIAATTALMGELLAELERLSE